MLTRLSFPTWTVRACAVVLLVLATAAAPAGARAGTPSARQIRQAEQLYAGALVRLRRDTIEDRRMAIADLERATHLVPEEPRYQLELARAYYRSGFLTNARRRYEQAQRLVPGDPESHEGIARVWRRDWLKYLDRGSLRLAIDHFMAAARSRPDDAAAWLELVPLRIETHEPALALDAAQHALQAAPEQPEARLAVAHAEFRTGQIERAAGDFTAAIPRLPPAARARFDDISPVASAQDTMILHRLSARGQAAYVAQFWREHDPDLTTSENEALLEYWSRVAQAYFLFFDARLEAWDERGEVYVRYGPPDSMDYNPVSARLSVSFGNVGNFPANVLVWDYRKLGMTVTMQDRLLSERYLLPITRTYDPDPMPDPDSLDADTDALATRGGRGVFPMLPPGTRPLPIATVLARFEGEEGPRLLAQLQTPGGPGDSLTARWVVTDSLRNELAHGARALSPSACDALDLRVADFAAELPPGEYTVGFSVSDGRHGRGVHRATTTLVSPRPRLALSDILVSCGAPVASPGRTVRPEPNPDARVVGDDPLTAYFEIYHLQPDARGLSQFEYVYTVRSAERDERIWLQRVLAPRPQPAPITASRAEKQVGTLRRQFLTVPVRELPPGRYELEVRVRDARARVTVSGTAEFVRVAG